MNPLSQDYSILYPIALVHIKHKFYAQNIRFYSDCILLLVSIVGALMMLIHGSHAGERPTTWDPMPLDIATNKEEVLHLAQLQPSSKEYQDVKAEFDKTMRMIPATGSGHARNTLPQAGLGFQASARMGRIGVSSLIGQSDTYSSIVTIERIQNPALYSQYVARKKQMDKQNPPRHQNERLLFHGTSVDSCGSINHGGFNRSFSGRNGKSEV